MRTQTSGECLRLETTAAVSGYRIQQTKSPKKGDLKERRDMNKTPNPGSDAAIKQGCDCPVLDNGHGRGVGGDGEKHGWWITADCPRHGKKEQE